jgi:signal transduction histidine kinase
MLLLTLVVVWVVAISAPAAYLVLGIREVRARAKNVSSRVSRVLQREVQLTPILWRYDTLKLTEHLRSITTQTGVLAVEVTDRHGVPIGLGDRRLPDRLALWGSATITANNQRFGTVWVAVSTHRVIRNTVLMLGGFAVSGVILAGLLFWIPMRAVRRAEREIRELVAELEESRSALERLNQDLERQVAERSSQLETTLEELRDKEHRLRELSARAIALQEAERRTIARNLHDTAGQSLTAIRIKLQLLQDLDGAGSLVDETITLTDETMEEIRRAVMSLGPAILDEIGLVAALERYLDDYAERTGLHVERAIELRQADLPGGLENACYHIVQEALNNVAKHAGASSVRLKLRRRGPWLRLEVQDDGRGFAVDSPADGATSGLRGMRERTELLGGSMTLSTTPGGGTRLAFELPLKQRGADR